MNASNKAIVSYCQDVLTAATKLTKVRIPEENLDMERHVPADVQLPITLVIECTTVLLEVGILYSNGLFAAEMQVREKFFRGGQWLLSFNNDRKIQPMRSLREKQLLS